MSIKKGLGIKKPDKSDMFLWLGAMAVCAGTGMIYMPAGIIIFGLFLVAVAFSEIRPGKGG